MWTSRILILALIGILSAGCSRVYYSPEAVQLSKTHESIAILPPSVSITTNKNIDPETLRQQERSESLNFQKEMVSWLLMRKGQYHVRFTIQDVTTTNALLNREEYITNNVMTSKEICERLGVDAVIHSNFNMNKPMSDGAAVVLGVFTGFWATTNELNISMDLFDRRTDQIIWNYHRTMSGSVLSSVTRMIDELMYDAFGRMPYIKKK